MPIRLRILFLILCFSAAHFSIAFAEEFRYDSHGARDPFVSPATGVVESVQSQKEVHLEGIVLDPNGGSVAIINGQMVREGDMIEGLILKKLEKNRALFDKNGEVLEVVLNKDDELMKESASGEKVNETSEPADNQKEVARGNKA